MKISYKNSAVKENMLKGGFGLEKEGLRVDKNGNFAKTLHPFPNDKKIQRDFCENQIEIITSVCPTVSEMMKEIKTLNRQVADRLLNLPGGEEYMWPFSNPPKVKGDKDIPIAIFKGDREEKTVYRRYLADKYGKKKMLFSGIHYNFSFDDKVLHKSYKELFPNREITFEEYNNSLYLDLAQKVLYYAWFIVYLTAASPVYDGSLFDDNYYGTDTFGGEASVRCGNRGYWNFFTPHLDYSSIENYASSIEGYVKDGSLYGISELYYPVRLKSAVENSLASLINNGVNHIELRMLDVNPLSRDGIFEEDLKFIHLLLVYLSATETMGLTNQDQEEAIINQKTAALFDIRDKKILQNGVKVDILSLGREIINNMADFFHCHYGNEFDGVFAFQLKKFTNPEERYCQQVYNRYKDGYNEKGLALAKEYALK